MAQLPSGAEPCESLKVTPCRLERRWSAWAGQEPGCAARGWDLPPLGCARVACAVRSGWRLHGGGGRSVIDLLALDIDGEQRHMAGLTIADNYVIPGGEERGGLRIQFTLDHPTTEFGLDGESTAESDQSVTGPRAGWWS